MHFSLDDYLQPCLTTIMLNWLRSIFNPPTEVSHVALETYRGEVKRPSQAAPEAPTFSPSVPWATATNLYLLPTTPPPKPPPPVEDPMGYFDGAGMSGCFIQHTASLRANLCYTGLVVHSSPDLWPHFATTG